MASCPLFFFRIAQRVNVTDNKEEKTYVCATEDNLEENTVNVQCLLRATSQLSRYLLALLSNERDHKTKQVREEMQQIQLSEGLLETIDS